jgi:hypothetical protein
MKKYLWILLILIFGTRCTKEVEKIIHTPPASGSLVGIVKQTGSGAKVYARQITIVDSAEINPENGVFQIDELPPGNYDVLIKASHFGSYWIRHVDIEGGETAYLGEITLSEIPDMVTGFYPEDQSEVVFSSRWSRLSISISFSNPMDRESVEAAFSTDPPSQGTFYWGTAVTNPLPVYFNDEKSWSSSEPGGTGAQITTYKKVRSFTYSLAGKDCFTDTTYTVTLSTLASDTAGNPLEFPLYFTFSTVQSTSTQNTILTDPENGDIYVDPLTYASIFISFPRRMDPGLTEQAISVSPATECIFVWPEMNKLRIYTGGPLKCDETYEITIDSTARDLDGVQMGESYPFSFETAPVEIENTYPQNGEIFVDTGRNICLRFNTYMLLSSVEQAFSITPDINGTFKRGWDQYDNESRDAVTFTPNGKYRVSTKYTVTLSKAAQDLHGTHLAEPCTFSFVTEPE